MAEPIFSDLRPLLFLGSQLPIEMEPSQLEEGSHRPRTEAHAVAPAAAGLSTRRRAETVMRLAGAAACLAAVAVTAMYVGGQGDTAVAHRDVLLVGKLSDNYYVDARVAQHREERLQELNELRREAQEKRSRKAALEAQETRQAEDEDKMADKQLERYNDIYTASTPEDAAMESQLPQGDLSADAKMDQKLDQYDAPAHTVASAYGRAGMTAYNGGVAPRAPTQNLAASGRLQRVEVQPQSVKGLVYAASEDLESLEARLDSSVMQEQRGSTQLKDIIDSSMLEIKGLAKRVGANLATAKAAGSTLRLSQPVVAAPRQAPPVEPAADPVQQATVFALRPAEPVETPAVEQQQAQVADDNRISKDKPYPSMTSMIEKYKAWMAAKKEMKETGRDPDLAAGEFKGVKTQGLISVPHGKATLLAAPGPCARINQAHAGDTAARENACANTKACNYDFGYQLCLQKQR